MTKSYVLTDEDHNATACARVMCQNNGTCIDHIIQNAFCICSLPYYGNMCQFKDVCYERPCGSNLICRQYLNNSYACEDKKQIKESSKKISNIIVWCYLKMETSLVEVEKQNKNRGFSVV